MASLREQLSTLGKGHEVLTIGQLEGAGISDQSVTRLVRQEALIRVDRGLYRLPDGPVSRNHEIICVATISPSSVIVLLSALAFHEIGTQQPHEVWVQLRAKGRVPELQWPKLRVVRTRISELFELGVETHHLGGQQVRPELWLTASSIGVKSDSKPVSRRRGRPSEQKKPPSPNWLTWQNLYGF